MKTLLMICLAVTVCSCGERKSEISGKDAPTLQIHFAGMENVRASTNASTAVEVWNMPESGALRNQTLKKLSTFFLLRSGAHGVDPAALHRLVSLMEDVLTVESLVAMSGAGTEPEWVIASRLDADHHEVWKATLREAIATWEATDVDDILSLRSLESERHCQLRRAGDWTLLSVGGASLPLTERLLGEVRASGRPIPSSEHYWLRADLPGALFKELPGVKDGAPLERLELTINGEEGNLRARATLTYAKTLDLDLKPWAIPTNQIYSPLISFVASQGMEDWLPVVPKLAHTIWESLPEHLYVWAMARVPMQTFVAIPRTDAKKELNNLGEKLIESHNKSLEELNMGGWQWNSNRTEVAWKGIPFIAPQFTAFTEGDTDYLFGGLFPNGGGTNPPPAALLSRIVDRTDLVHYDWEITEGRLPEWLYLSQLYLMLTKQKQLPQESAAFAWMEAIGPKLGNTVTEVTQSGPKELALARKGHIGMTALEIILLANWVESDGFPSLEGSRAIEGGE